MKKRRLWVCIGLLLLVIGGILTALLEPTQTVRGYFAGDAFYRGRPTRYWREQLRADGRDFYVSQKNVQLFRETQEAFPVLRACASDPNRYVRWRVIALLGQGNARSEDILSVLVGALDDGNVDVCLKAISALDQWGPMARSAVPALAKLLKDPEIQIAYAADTALWNIDPSAAVKECGWKPFRSNDWNFTVMLSNEPEHTEESLIFYSVHMYVSVHKYGPHTGDSAYGIGVFEIPTEWLEGKSKEDFLAKARDSTVERFGGKLIGGQPVEQNGRSGIEYRIEVERDGTPLLVRARLFWVDNRLYQVYVSGVPKFLNARAADYFMDSFQVDKPERKGSVPSGSPHPQQNQHRK
ncbi:MAG TPA: HEAT repeat domain-containing protein [Gemmataceae bacterium]|nr:HEAT repeat domain-containing protein [Gemmataceae bacterium]